jgi:ribosome-associated protein
MSPLSAEATVRAAARAALDKKAEEVAILDLRGLSGLSDYFLIMSAASVPHVDSVRDAIREALRALGTRPRHVEGAPASGWVLLDYGDVVIHIFLRETREFYALDRLWGDATVLSPAEVEAPAGD